MGKPFYQVDVETTLNQLGTRITGLSATEVANIKARVGTNVIPKVKQSFIEKYIKPVINLMIVILFFAAVLQFVLSGFTDYFGPGLILAILFINITIAMFQQFKVEKTLEALERLTAFKAKVIRDNTVVEIEADQLVPGDIMVLKNGDYISADARLIEANELTIDESVLTGESVAVEKIIGRIDGENLQLQEQKNMVFSSTFVASGNGKAVVSATGLTTEIGKITKGIATKEHREIPLQKQMNKLGTGLGLLVLGIIAILFVIQIIKGSEDLVSDMSWLVSLAIAAIPFNFPLITTIILLTGVLHLARKQAIVRKLNAIETMGRLSIICSDKTGTLTQNQMTVQNIYYNNTLFNVSGLGYQPEGQILLNGAPFDAKSDPLFNLMLINGIINNNSEIVQESVNLKKGSMQVFKVIGMPTEGALITLAQKAGINIEQERKLFHIYKEFAFSSERKRMSKVVKYQDQVFLVSKGAPERLLELCSEIILNQQPVPLSADVKNDLLLKLEKIAAQGLRTLGFSYRLLDSEGSLEGVKADQLEYDMTFLGFVSVLDPAREGVKESVDLCHSAGINVAMITGDHPITAKSIATSLGIYKEGDLVVAGQEIKQKSADEITKTSVFARVAPEDKLTIVKALQAKGQIVAMTGDGVNDALALENADVGIAMGIAGTDVAKNAADLILTDDSFTTIETAIYHGRGLFNNIRSNIVFLLVCNLMELTVLTFISLFFSQQLFTSWQLYILYATIHFFPPLGLMFDKYDPNIMKEPPKKMDEPLINKNYRSMMVLQIITIAATMIILFLLIFYKIYEVVPANEADVLNPNSPTGVGYAYPGYEYNEGYVSILQPDGAAYIRLFKARTICFVVLVFSEIWIALESRSVKTSILKLPFNLALTLFLLFVLGILAVLTMYNLAQAYLNMVPLTTTDWIIAFCASLPVVILTEIYKKI